jgi:hypothetical protein
MATLAGCTSLKGLGHGRQGGAQAAGGEDATVRSGRVPVPTLRRGLRRTGAAAPRHAAVASSGAAALDCLNACLHWPAFGKNSCSPPIL